MLSDNIRNYRKKLNISQDELAEKLSVSRQSVSLWENGQTQPTIDNIIALSKIFNISSDVLLGNIESESVSHGDPANSHAPAPVPQSPNNKKKLAVVITVLIAVILIAAGIIAYVFLSPKDEDENSRSGEESGTEKADVNIVCDEDSTELDNEKETLAHNHGATESTANNSSGGGNKSETTTPAQTDNQLSSNSPVDGNNSGNKNDSSSSTSKPAEDKADQNASDTSSQTFDLFTYCKNFAIEKGVLNGDYSIYQQPSAKYGGYDNEYFSISYWADSDMVEFCLHCPLSETYSHNFYIRMRGGYNHKYEYLSSKYYRDTGESLRSATGYIDPSVFSDSYPISCDSYEGSADGQTQFMEDSRVGICDLIKCLKQFVSVENMDCSFSDFEFINF